MRIEAIRKLETHVVGLIDWRLRGGANASTSEIEELALQSASLRGRPEDSLDNPLEFLGRDLGIDPKLIESCIEYKIQSHKKLNHDMLLNDLSNAFRQFVTGKEVKRD